MGILSVNRKAAMLITVALLSVGLSLMVANAETLTPQVAREGKLTIGIHNRWPWGFKKDDGTVSGVHPDVLKDVVEPLGVKEVDFIVMDFGALIPSLMSRRIDAVASGMNITPERCKQVSFSEPFMATGDAAIVKAGNPLNIHSYADMAKNSKVRVGDARGTSTTENAIASGVPSERIQLFQDYNELVAALLADRVDAILMTSGTALGILNDPKIKGLERAAPFTGRIMKDGKEALGYSAIAFRPEDADFRDRFNKSLAARKSEGTVWEKLSSYGFVKSELAGDEMTAETICQGNYR
ncbi:ectoine/hydroxyectoine ABC transporter substrate-binding protein EhuB [Mesorhizobium sp. M4B.F.Ca.ET.143.01.1.1]|uniref:ectoine/hydroxyectoine ABC transporter substrate-binding protein EhuB n=2 Tax=unclassified Mesorhizobium TaxID=325217 RepID=UPI001093A894|nr:ectoine/hydroxyectoine ABC transporter substrate-binding protein EhuB [Mesorhizobium sp. M4B.F.Ca.ET.143.01.1.1]TGV22670.1 ectoine/hydroxyectoine ABC transporter substrate-binding protein EhuB [Mesorhizobium sp. M4B.F.Ca.ET.143.01.1.1]